MWIFKKMLSQTSLANDSVRTTHVTSFAYHVTSFSYDLDICTEWHQPAAVPQPLQGDRSRNQASSTRHILL